MIEFDGLGELQERRSPKKGISSKEIQVDETLRDIVDNLAEEYLQQGNPILAACTHLSINDPSSAVIKLIRANQLSFAYILCKLFKLNLINYITWLVAKKADKSGIFDLGFKLIKSLNQPLLLALFGASSYKSDTVLNDLYSKVASSFAFDIQLIAILTISRMVW